VDCLLYFGYLVNDEDGNFIARPKEDQTIEISHGLTCMLSMENTQQRFNRCFRNWLRKQHLAELPAVLTST
jgi:hypothetical protein